MNIIEIKNISKTYCLGKLDVPVLHDICLSIDEGEFVVIMGHSGSGKSTLLHILGLLDKPTGGQYLLAGEEVAGMSDDHLAALRNRLIGYVFQQFNLLARLSAKENVALPLIYAPAGGAHGDAGRLLADVGLADRMRHKPNELSGGQQQRVAIARALVNQPLLIFADEPTGNLDSKSTTEIIQILKKLNSAGITIVMVTHEPDLAQVASRIIRLEDGRIVQDERKVPAAAQSTHRKPVAREHPVFNMKRVRDYFTQAMRSLISNKTRSALSILGVLIGVASLIAMLALGTGAQEDVKKRISSLGSNLLMVRSGGGSRGGVSLGAGAVTRFTLQDADEIKRRIPGVEKVAPYVNGKGQVVYGGKNWNTSIMGTTADYPALRNSFPKEGRFFTEQETIARAKVALIGKTVAEQLFDGNDFLHKFIKIQRVDFLVIGLLPDKGSSGFRDENDQIIIPINTAMYRLMGKEFIDNMDVQVAQPELMDDVSDRIRSLLTSLHRLPASKSESIEIRNMADIQETISATIKTFSYLLGSIAFISLLVGGIGIMNIMLVSVSERTKEIGLRKAIGANNKDILFQFVIESVTVCILGGIIGIFLGTGISLILAKFAGWSTIVSLSSVGMSFVFSVLIGLIFGVWPARKASRLNPIDALRYE